MADERCNHDPSDVAPDGPGALEKLGGGERLNDREEIAANRWTAAYAAHDPHRASTTLGGRCRVCGQVAPE